MAVNIFVEGKTFEKQSYKQNPLPKGEYDDCTFNNCDFSEADLFAIDFIDCRFVDCNLSLANIAKASFKNVSFVACKLLGLHFEHCNPFLLSVSFKDCNINLSSFYRLKLKSTHFENCSLNEVDFNATDLTQSKFVNCDLADAKFDQSNLEKVDFSTAYNYTINPESNRVKKAKFSVNGLAGLLSHYDILVDH